MFFVVFVGPVGFVEKRFQIFSTMFSTKNLAKTAGFVKNCSKQSSVITGGYWVVFSTLLTFLGKSFLYLLKNVEIVIIHSYPWETRDMKQQVMKALANPARIFYVPYTLAVMNFVIQFLIFVAIFITSVLAGGDDMGMLPLFFLGSVCVVHFILAGVAKREPQLGQIIAAKIKLFKLQIPKRLAA